MILAFGRIVLKKTSAVRAKTPALSLFSLPNESKCLSRPNVALWGNLGLYAQSQRTPLLAVAQRARPAPATSVVAAYEMINSTRRFCCRPSAVAFEATGDAFP